MGRIIHLVAFIGCLVSTSVSGIGNSAFHSHGTDHFGDGLFDGANTRYTPLFIDPVPDGVIVDEVYLRIEFKSGESASIDRLQDVRCGAAIELSPSQFTYLQEGQNLFVSYGFADRSDEVFLATGDCWSFLVTGEQPILEVEAVITYHTPGHTAMPNLYGTDDSFPGGTNLLAVDSVNLDLVLQEDRMTLATGVEIPAHSKKVVVLIHGWNPKDYFNHFAPGIALGVADSESFPEADRLQYGFVNLCKNLVNNAALRQEGWSVARYDWARDASTGEIWTPPLTFDIRAADQSRDAAHAHGLKLGRSLAEGRSLKSVHFVAHSAGNWVARRASEYLRNIFGDAITIHVTSLDPFVNDDDPITIGDDLNLKPDFELMREWVDYLDNYYVVDFSTDENITGVYWTSGSFVGWDRNVDLELLTAGQLYETYMDDHGGPVYWYGLTADAALQLSLTANPNPAVPNGSIFYHAAVGNLGPVTTSMFLNNKTPEGVRIWESMVTAGGDCLTALPCGPGEVLNWTINQLVTGETQSYQFVAEVESGSVITDGMQANDLIAVHHHGWGVVSRAQTELSLAREIMVNIVPDQTVVAPGDAVSFTVLVTNIGLVNPSNLRLTASVPSGLTFESAEDEGILIGGNVQWDISNIDVGGVRQMRFTAKADGTLINGIQLNGEATIYNSSTSEVMAVSNAILVIQDEKLVELSVTTGPDPVRPGEQVYATLTVSNRSGEELTNVLLSVPTPDYTQLFEEDTTWGDCIAAEPCRAGEVVQWVLGSLPPGESRAVQMATRVDTGSLTPPDGTLLSVNATVNYDGGSAAASRSLVVDSTPSLVLSLEADQASVSPGGLLTYTLRYLNPGGVDMSNVMLSAPVPVGTSFVSATGGATLASGQVEWILGTLVAGGSGQARFTVQVDAGAVDGSLFVAEAEVRGSGSTPALARGNVSTLVHTANPLSLSVTIGPDPVRPGEQVYAMLTVSNTGASPVSAWLSVPTPDYTELFNEDITDGGVCLAAEPCRAGEVIRWTLGTLVPGESRTLQMATRVDAGTSPPPEGALLSVNATLYSNVSQTVSRAVVVNSGAPLVTDFDDDGLENNFEFGIRTFLFIYDSDGDGVSDFDEVAYDGDSNNYTVGQDLNPLNWDSDGDGFSDYDELIAGTDPLDNTSFPVTADGDLNVDDAVDAGDVLLAQRILMGQVPLTQEYLDHGDVAPLVNGVPAPDGQFNLGDLLVIQRKALGLINF